MKIWLIPASIIFIIGIFLMPFLFSNDDEFTLNQFFIQEKMLEYNTYSSQSVLDYLISKYLFGWNNIISHEKPEDVIFDDQNSVFDYVFKKLPSYSIVYPTELYYYYTIKLPDINISGNLRLADVEDGTVHIGYFEIEEPRNSNAASFTKTNGIMTEKIFDDVIKVTYQGKSVYFKLNDIAHKMPENLKLLESEEFVAHIQDESGLRFFLFYNHDVPGFYYILDEENGFEDNLVSIKENFFQAERTSYIFYYDSEYERKILVGVYKPDIYSNNYFDGPFDQVPPRLEIKQKLLEAYPYTAYAGGIDEYGNFRGFQETRVAISPYYDYDSTDDLLNYLSRCQIINSKSEFWGCLTYEWKKDFHKQLEAYNQTQSVHYVFLSQGWPANHYGNQSLMWPFDHESSMSNSWPPNHESDFSRK